MEHVVLVDEMDNEIGVMEKIQAHKDALLHRAFSVFVFDDSGRLLLQKRAHSKYHSPGLWTNTCCSHPRQNEKVSEAAKRRLFEEMGFHCDLDYKFKFIYKAELDQGLSEHELDHVFFGNYNGNVNFNPLEVSEYGFFDVEKIREDIKLHPEKYTVWFKIIFDKIHQLRNGNSN